MCKWVHRFRSGSQTCRPNPKPYGHGLDPTRIHRVKKNVRPLKLGSGQV